MKKLSALIAMILCVTIGGVYAAWTYTNPEADITDERFEQLITISTATESGAAGEYDIVTNITGMSIEQLGTNSLGKDFHTAVLNYTTNDNEAPYVKFTLTLKENTGDDIFNTLVSKYSIGVVDVNQYGGNDIFDDIVDGETVIVWQQDPETGVYYYQVNINEEIVLNEFVLASKSQHTQFTSALGRAVLEVKITDGILPTGTNP